MYHNTLFVGMDVHKDFFTLLLLNCNVIYLNRFL